MNDLEGGTKEFNCMICLDNKAIVRKTYCDKVKKINCQCNTYCHTKCIKENIFKHNNGSQICFVCKKEYNPKYEKNLNENKFLKTIYYFIKTIYCFFVYFLFFFIFFIFCGYLFQLFGLLLFNKKMILDLFNLLFFLEGMIGVTFVYLLLTKCNPQNTDNLFVKLLTKFSVFFNVDN